MLQQELTQSSRIYVAGHRGLVGSAVVRALNLRGHTHFVARTRDELDLTNQAEVRKFFDAERPEVVILAAARVGGIYANHSRPALFIRDNLLIQDNVIDAAHNREYLSKTESSERRRGSGIIPSLPGSSR
jgi:GDP-L-fucose synthase